MGQNAVKDTKPNFPFIYFLFCLLLYIVALPLLCITALRAKHRDSIPARFSPFLALKKLEKAPDFWFHACSYGEIKSLEPIFKALDSKPCTILITTITHTGFNEAKRLYANRQDSKLCVMVHYLPFEIFLPFWAKSCKNLQCLVVTEAELWKMLFYIAKSRNARTLLINARISQRSLTSYQRFGRFYQGIFAFVDEVLAQSSVDKERLESLGAKNVSIFGNLKTLNTPTLSATYTKPSRPIFCAASTHRGEEKLVLETFQALCANLQSQNNTLKEHPLLLIAPRHPERFKEVYELTQSFFQTSLFSQHKLEVQSEIQAIVIDTLGELNNLYAISDVVILCGSFMPNIGGHNPLEPAFFHTKLISGEHIFNQYALFEEVQNYVLIPPQSLQDTLSRWQELPQSSIKLDSNHKLTLLIQKIDNAN